MNVKLLVVQLLNKSDLDDLIAIYLKSPAVKY